MPHLPLWLLALLAVLVLPAALYLLHRVLLRMERKGWIYYRTEKPKGTMRSVFSGFETFVHPEIRYVQEERDQRTEERSTPSSPSDR
jgi:hypothetical protein